MDKKHLPSNAPWVLLLLLTLVGIGLSVDLTYIHVKANLDPLHKSFCSPNARINCDSVARSASSRLLGAPVSVWGLWGYLLILITVVLGRLREARTPSLLGVLLGLTGFSTIASAWMAYLSFAHVGAICVLCLLMYVINPVLFFLAWGMMNQRGQTVGASFAAGLDWATSHLQYVVLVAFVTVVIPLAYPKYWEKDSAAQPSSSAGMLQLPNGLDAQGHPWIGSTLPALTITTFSDYECPFCQRANFRLRELLVEAADVVRVIHRHYPLDQACNPSIRELFHPKACLFAYAAYCAGKQGQFWGFSDQLYIGGKRLDKAQLAEKAKELGLNPNDFAACLDSEQAQSYVKQDILDGTQKMVQGTPTFFVKGRDHALPQGFTAEGHAWIGAEKPRVTLEEFTDYECPSCQRAHQSLRDLVRQHKDTLRLIHRHYPLDQACNTAVDKPFHQKACLLAKASHCAGKQKLFWPFNDLLYETHKTMDGEKLVDWAFYLGLDRKAFALCLAQDKETDQHIQQDIQAGQRLQLRGTPAFLLNGKLYTGSIPTQALQAALAPPSTSRSIAPIPTAPRSIAPIPTAPRPIAPIPTAPRPIAPLPRTPTSQPLRPLPRTPTSLPHKH